MIVRLRLVGVTTANPDARQGSNMPLDPGGTVADLIATIDPDQPDHMAVFVNGDQVEEKDWAEKPLSESDEIVLIRPLEGGVSPNNQAQSLCVI